MRKEDKLIKLFGELLEITHLKKKNLLIGNYELVTQLHDNQKNIISSLYLIITGESNDSIVDLDKLTCLRAFEKNESVSGLLKDKLKVNRNTLLYEILSFYGFETLQRINSDDLISMFRCIIRSIKLSKIEL